MLNEAGRLVEAVAGNYLLWFTIAVFTFIPHLEAACTQQIRKRVHARVWKIFLYPGVLVHELSHALMALVFGHKVSNFHVGTAMGTIHGSVETSWRKISIIEQVGCFFVGMAPVIIGPILVGLIWPELPRYLTRDTWWIALLMGAGCLTLAFSSAPSHADYKVAARGVISVLILACLGLWILASDWIPESTTKAMFNYSWVGFMVWIKGAQIMVACHIVILVLGIGLSWMQKTFRA